MGCSPSSEISRGEFEARMGILQTRVSHLEEELSQKTTDHGVAAAVNVSVPVAAAQQDVFDLKMEMDGKVEQTAGHGLRGAHHGVKPVSSSSPAKPLSKIKFPLKPGTEVSLSDASRVQTSNVKELWQLADATCVKKHKLKPRVLKKRKGWKTIRLFVSSTFTDFYSEREILVKEVFPDLKVWCQSRKLHLVECDLRWGVPKDTTSEETLKMCLSEIDRCFEDNSEPFFLNMLGEKAGWIPEPVEVPGLLGAQYGWIHGMSVTEMEILHGAYRTATSNALFMMRDADIVSSIPEGLQYLFVDSNPRAPEKLAALKKNISKRFPKQCCPYNAEFSRLDNAAGRVELKQLESFAKQVYEFFRKQIEISYPLDEGVQDILEFQRAAHEIFLDSRGQTVLGREEILDELQSYIIKSKSNAPVMLVGSAGAGKSAIIARSAVTAIGNAREGSIPGAGLDSWQVFYHFVGAAPGSTDIGRLLQRILRELNFVKGDAPSDIEKLIQETQRALSSEETKPSILFIDAINQLDNDPNAKAMKWLPETLSSHVRVIVSMINQTEYHRSLLARSNCPYEVFCGPLNLAARKDIITETFARYNKRLDDSQMRLLLSKDGSANPLWLSLACEELRLFGSFEKVLQKIRELADDLLSLLEQILSRLEEENGGVLVVATLCFLECSRHGLLESELLRLLGDEDNLLPPDGTWQDLEEDNLVEMKEIGQIDVQAIVDDLRATVEQTYRGPTKMAKGFEVTGIDSSVPQAKKVPPLPAAKWSLVYRGLRRFLRPCGEGGEGRLDFYHRSMSKAVRRKYFIHDEDRYTKFWYTWWHGKLAGFFESHNDLDRRSEELPYHLEQLLDHSRLARCLVEWPMFDRLFEEHSRIDLLKSWRKAGGYKAASACYREALSLLRQSSVSREELSVRLEKVARFLSLAGEYSDAFGLLEESQRIEEQELGARPDRMADLLYSLADTKSEVAKLQDFIDANTAVQSKGVIDLASKSISIRRSLQGEENERKLGMALLVTSFHMSSYSQARGKDPGLTPEQATQQGVDMAKEAIKTFQKLGDGERLAESYMVVGLHIQSSDPAQLEYLQKGLSLCLRVCGRYHMLSARFHINIGIYYEDNGDFIRAYELFKDWAEICTEVYGPAHPKTKRARGTLQEPRYVSIAQQMATEKV